jgi:AraC-like DNA-binding protein
MFPIIISSSLGKNQAKQSPKIKTLQNYIHISNKEFERIFRESLDTNKHIGIIMASELISAFYNFDNENEKTKSMVIEFVENPEFGSIKYYFKQLFRIK